MITNRFVSELWSARRPCPILRADWECRFAVNCGQTRSGTVISAAPSTSDVLERHQAAVLLAWALSSGRRGRRFKSGHPDQKSRLDGLTAHAAAGPLTAV